MDREKSLTQFAIYGLYGERNIVIPFNHPTKILVSENGVGKTTVLNALYVVLTSHFFKLTSLDFERIVLTFNHDEITINKSDLLQIENQNYYYIYKEIKQKLLDIDFNALMEFSREFPLEKLMEHPRLLSAAKALETPPRLLATQLRKFSTVREEGVLSTISEKIKANFDYEVIYFPTYRRIEENLSNLGYVSQSPNVLLQSSMSDVSDHIEQITSEIAALRIDRLLTLAKLNSDHIYDQEQKKQNAIKTFINVCNPYLFDKQFVYNDKQIKIELILTKNNRPITLDKLSSGEKQIVSIFSILYLASSKKNLVIFDEPELSISMEWQKMLLPDVLKSPQCHGIIAATHSPFIFDNNLNAYTVALNEYIEEI
jgi:predicted ATPase